MICLILLYSLLLFYWCWATLFRWHLDQVPAAERVTEPFEKMIEIDTADYRLQRQQLTPFPMAMGATPFPMGLIVIETDIVGW